jgi:hypothetical protein
MVLAVALAFFPAIRLALAVVVAPLLLLPERAGNPLRGALLALGAAAVAAALAFPLVAHLADAGGGAAIEANAPPDFGSLLRLSAGDAPGGGPTALFLPVAGLVGFVLAEGRSRRAAWRALIAAALAVPLAWLAAAGRLPAPLSNPVAFLAVAAVSLAFLVGLGTEGLGRALRRTAFGAPQALGALLVGVLVLGVTAQSVQGLLGSWAVGQDRLPPAWPVVGAAEAGLLFRVLWLGPDDGRPFPPPGGDPDGAVAGRAPVAYGVTGPDGRSVLATALPAAGPPYRHLERILSAVLAGRIRHGGALLAPMGIRYVVAGEGRLPDTAEEALAGQVDLDLLQRAGGLSIYRNARVLPPAAIIPGQAPVDAARSASLLAPLSFDPVTAAPLAATEGGWRGAVAESPSLVLLGDRFDPRWRAGREVPFPAFGWALGFEGSTGPVAVASPDRTRRAVELAVLAALWLVALWFVRQPSRAELPAEARAAAGVAEVAAGEPAGSRA